MTVIIHHHLHLERHPPLLTGSNFLVPIAAFCVRSLRVNKFISKCPLGLDSRMCQRNGVIFDPYRMCCINFNVYYCGYSSIWVLFVVVRNGGGLDSTLVTEYNYKSIPHYHWSVAPPLVDSTPQFNGHIACAPHLSRSLFPQNGLSIHCNYVGDFNTFY